MDKWDKRRDEIKESLRIVILNNITIRLDTQAQAAKLLDVTQPRVSNLRNGKLDRFSIDELMRMASVFGENPGVYIELRARDESNRRIRRHL